MNSKDLDNRIEELTLARNSRRSSFISTTDKTRDFAGSVQNGMYWGQIALNLFRKLTNYHYSPKKRIKQAVITVAAIVAAHLLRKAIARKNQK